MREPPTSRPPTGDWRLKVRYRAIVVERCDFLVIGSGIAGLSFALEAARIGSVVVVNKTRLPESATTYAQGGIASVWSPEDSFAQHSQDTMIAGADLCHAEVVDLVVR